jgi:hypothetical protein
MGIGQSTKAQLLGLGGCIGGRHRGPGNPIRLVALWLVGLLWLPNCSLLFTKPVSTASDGSPVVPCSTSRVPPTIDAVMAALDILGVMAIAARQDKHKDILLSGSLLGTGVYLGSAIYGLRNTKACRAGGADMGEDDMRDAETPPDPDIVTKPQRQTRPAPDPGLTHGN